MNRRISITPEPMTKEAFAPFGWLIEPPGRPDDRRTLSPVEFGCDGKTTVSVIWQPSTGVEFSCLERHFGVTQTFFQLAGAPAVVCVAPATDPDDLAAIPDPATVRAFRIDPSKGYAFARGIWHSMDRYLMPPSGSEHLAAEPAGATFVILNVDPNPTQVIDYADGRSTLYADLDVDAAPRRETLRGDFGITFEIEVTDSARP